jgi:toxin YhaV
LPLVVNGWSIYAYPDFAARLRTLREEVEKQRRRDPERYRATPAAKVLAALRRVALVEIPSDPGASRFRQGGTLGKQHRFWRRAKFLARFRLFFRYSTDARVIVYVWLNDENTLRKEGSRTDPYHVFKDMLERGRPPSDWNELISASTPMAPDEAVDTVGS